MSYLNLSFHCSYMTGDDIVSVKVKTLTHVHKYYTERVRIDISVNIGYQL